MKLSPKIFATQCYMYLLQVVNASSNFFIYFFAGNQFKHSLAKISRCGNDERDKNIPGLIYCHTRLHLGFSAKLRIWQVPASKMEPRSGIIFCLNRPAGRPPDHLSVWGSVSQLLLTRSSPNFIDRFVRPSVTADNCHGDICPCNTCPGQNALGQEIFFLIWIFS